MLIGYARVSKSDGSQSLDLQIDALIKAGVQADKIYQDMCGGSEIHRPGLDACSKGFRKGDLLVVYKLDRLGRSIRTLIEFVEWLNEKGVGLKVLAGQGAQIDTSTPNGRFVFNLFAALAEYERELISERTRSGLAAARARGRKGGRPKAMTPNKLAIAQSAMKDRNTSVQQLCKELGISRQTLYRHLNADGSLK